MNHRSSAKYKTSSDLCIRTCRFGRVMRNSRTKYRNGPLTSTEDLPDPRLDSNQDENHVYGVDDPPRIQPHAQCNFGNENHGQADFDFDKENPMNNFAIDKENAPINPRGNCPTAKKTALATLQGTGEPQVRQLLTQIRHALGYINPILHSQNYTITPVPLVFFPRRWKTNNLPRLLLQCQKMPWALDCLSASSILKVIETLKDHWNRVSVLHLRKMLRLRNSSCLPSS